MYATHFAPDGVVVCRTDASKTRHWLVTTDPEAVTCYRCKAHRPPEVRYCARVEVCGQALPAGRRRFCSDACARAQRRVERITEDDEYVRAVGRQIVRLGPRASRNLEVLAALAQAVKAARQALAIAVDGARAVGYSDREIGHALGVSHQAVQQRFARQDKVAGAGADEGVA